MSFNSSFDPLNRPLENFEGGSENSNNSSDNIKLGEMNGRSIHQISSKQKEEGRVDSAEPLNIFEIGYLVGKLGYMMAKRGLNNATNQILNSSYISPQNNKPKQD